MKRKAAEYDIEAGTPESSPEDMVNNMSKGPLHVLYNVICM